MDIKDLSEHFKEYVDKEVELDGWVKQSRFSKNVGFIQLNDGTYFSNVQIVISSDNEMFEEISKLGIYSSINVKGKVVLTTNAKQEFEVQADELKVYSDSDKDYPIQNKRHSFEYLRTVPTLRVRTNTYNAAFRVRSEIAFAIHKFFNDRNFVYVHTPIITNTDAEGAGDMFDVTTLDINDPPRDTNGDIDYTKDFFGSETHLTVSGQLEVESFAMAYKKVYTFGPTFRAEDSNTPRHAAEFWMVEPEIAFTDFNDLLNLEEEMVKYVIRHVMENLPKEMEFFNSFVDKGLIERLNNVLDNDFERITYTKAIEILEKSDQKFDYKVEWGSDLQTEHERYLTEQVYHKPVFVTDYPKEIKAFYMKLNDDGKTVQAVDLLVPGVGELIGGSQREENTEKLIKMMEEKNMNIDLYQWYIDLRRFGGVQHGGFGLGFERMVMYVTGIKNIRDVLPFPRTVNSLHK